MYYCLLLFQVVYFASGRPGDSRSHIRRVLHSRCRPRKPARKGTAAFLCPNACILKSVLFFAAGESIADKLGAGGPVLVAAQRGARPHRAAVVHRRLPLVSARGRPVQLHIRVPSAGHGLERPSGRRLRRPRRSHGRHVSAMFR